MLSIVTNKSTADHPSAPDPRALRALAHPLRWQLLDLIESEATATATRCAGVLGETVANCSYHLGILGRYGYIELVPGHAGKEKPWRLASQQQNLDPGGLDTEGALAAEAATGAFLDHELARMKHRLGRLGLEPEPWRSASLLIGSTTWMTAEELHDISEHLKQLVLTHMERAADPVSRPPGAREVRLFAVASVAPPVTPSKDSAPQA
jgi:hypothetical protein